MVEPTDPEEVLAIDNAMRQMIVTRIQELEAEHARLTELRLPVAAEKVGTLVQVNRQLLATLDAGIFSRPLERPTYPH